MSAVSPAPDLPLPGASASESYRRFWQRAVVFTGRAGRAEYWWPLLVNAVVLVGIAVLLGVVAVVGLALDGAGSPAVAVTNALLGVLWLLSGLFLLALVVPSVAVGVRRLHDADLSGWLLLLALLPSVGGVILTILHVLPSNARGRRFDRGRAVQAPVEADPPAAPARPALVGAAAATAFEAWPGSDAPHPATAPVPVAERGPAEEPPADPGAAVRRAWSRLGEVAPVEPPMAAPPTWRQQGYLLVSRPDGSGLLATDGLSGSQGATALGAGAEVYLAGRSLHAADAAGRWELAAVAAVARRVATSGMHLPSELERHGTLSMTLPGVPAPDGLRTPAGGLGVLIGLPSAGVPETVQTPGGEVRLASVTPLTPDELQQIVDGGAGARARIAGHLAALPPRGLLERG